MGVMYANGEGGVPQDYDKAIEWLLLATEQRYAPALRTLAHIYDNGIGGIKDSEKAEKLYQLAASQGNVSEKDNIKHESSALASALLDLEARADEGDALVQRDLGIIYVDGNIIPKDYVKAEKYFKLAAEQGLASAQYNLGVMNRDGAGISQNAKSALKWFRAAAEQGHASAQFNLGVMYSEGQGTAKDDKTAVKWYKLAVEQKLADAQYNLGYMYHFGRGIEQDYEMALKLYRMAAEQGQPYALQYLEKIK